MRLIDADALKNAILVKGDNLEDNGLLDDMRGLYIALDLIDQAEPVCAVLMDDVMQVLEATKRSVMKKAIKSFNINFMWQIEKEQR